LLKNPQGCTRRIVLDNEGQNQWETFCKVHAGAVNEPFKPKVKAKMQMAIEEDELPPAFSLGASANSAKKESKSRLSDIAAFNPVQPTAKGRALSMAHAKNFFASRLLTSTMLTSNSSSSNAATAKAPNRAAREEYEGADDADADDSEDSDAGPSAGRRKGKTVGRKGTKGTAPPTAGGPSTRGSSSAAGAGRTFPILSMNEWPGLSEGEPMDLDHFWNVVGSFHPEDHSAEVGQRLFVLFRSHQTVLLVVRYHA
jgi:hypothetical protein